MLAIAAVSVTSKISLAGSTVERSSSCSIIASRSGSPTIDSPLRLMPTRGTGADRSGMSWIARCTTQRSMAWIRPKRSAAGRNAPGRDQLAAVALHPQQQLAVLDLPGGELEDRLEVQDEPVVLEGVLDPL